MASLGSESRQSTISAMLDADELPPLNAPYTNGDQPPEPPPPSDSELEELAAQILGHDDAPHNIDQKGRKVEAAEVKPASRIVDFQKIGREAPPPRQWIIPQWLSWAPTLLAGKGGIGKSLLALQTAYALASESPIFGHTSTSDGPLRVLYWACEDDYDELWRRLTGISIAAKVPLSSVNAMILDARAGLENELYTTEYGRGMWTPNYGLLHQQVNDYKADVLFLDNIAHLYSAGENSRPAVTAFVNGILGLCMDRPFCPILLGHPAKAEGSEFSGSTAWENAVRMRWFLSDKLPDQAKEDDDQPPTDNIRYLSKRKTNYTHLDYMQLAIEDGAFRLKSGEIGDNSTMATLRLMRCKTLILAAIPRINLEGLISSEAYGANYLPKQMIAHGWHEGHTKGELHRAMMELFGEGKIVKDVVGKDNARRPRHGLIVV